jgi:hypothetical protein
LDGVVGEMDEVILEVVEVEWFRGESEITFFKDVELA